MQYFSDTIRLDKNVSGNDFLRHLNLLFGEDFWEVPRSGPGDVARRLGAVVESHKAQKTVALGAGK